MTETILRSYLRDQQSRACNLEGLLDALLELNVQDVEPGGQTAIITVARDLAAKLNAALDSVSLPG